MKAFPFFLTTILLVFTACVKVQNEPTYFSASPRNASTPAEGGEITIEVECDFTWNASLKSGRWLHVKSMDKEKSPATITLSSDWTADYDIRRDTLEIKSGSSTINVPVAQQGLSTIVSTPEILLKETATVALVINAHDNWTAEAASSWFTISPSSGKSGSSIMKVTAKDPNLNVGDRTSLINMAMGGMTFNVSVIQKQKDALLLSADKVEIPCKKNDFEIICKSNVDFSVTIDGNCSSWLSKSNGNVTKSLNEERLVFTAEANEEYAPRKGTITFASAGLSETLTVCQAERSMLIFEKDTISISSKGENLTIDLRANVDYTISLEGVCDWVRVTAPSSVRVDKLFLEVDRNDSCSDRSATLAVSDRNSDLTQKLTIRQAQNNAVILDGNEIRIPNKKGTFTVNLRSNIGYEVNIPEKDRFWLSTVKTKGLESSSVTFLAEANDDDAVRSSSVVFIAEDASDTLTVTQAERDMIVLTPQMADVEFYGGLLEIKTAANVGYRVSVDGNAGWIGRSDTRITVNGIETFRIEENKTGETRSGLVYFEGIDSDISDTLTVIQFARPNGTFLDSCVPGSYGSLGPGWTYSRQTSQIGTRKQGDHRSFILLFPKDRNVLELKGLPESFSPGDRIELERVSHTVSGTSTRKGSAVIMQYDGESVWLSYEDDEKYIVKLIDWK